MRWMFIVCLVLGCGNTRRAERGQVVVTAVETIPLKYPGKKE
ncbi:MAG: hypothetical protein U0796_07020 [Gemmatales bacterium]